MAERSPFPFTACIDHGHYYPCREVVTVSANCDFKSEKSLEERQPSLLSFRGTCPDKIPVIVEKAGSSQIPYALKRLDIRADSNLADLFVAIWNKIFKVERGSKTYSLFMILKHKDPVFKKLLSSVYDDYKDEDGFLCITLSGEIQDILPQPSPSNISAKTFYVTNMPRDFKLYHERKDGGLDLFVLYFEYVYNKSVKDDCYLEFESSKCRNPSKLCFYLAATGLEYKEENIMKLRRHVKQFRESGQMEMDMGMTSCSAAPDISNGESRSKYVRECYYVVALILFVLSVKLVIM
ncbi:uncharacterized protein LOC141689413 [Apium graveolens]|uniref:uncharacterized protein LOC141689413 n=1 Tax=Apium graveolens TaxID=4045 RepID=UPI003D7AAFAF